VAGEDELVVVGRIGPPHGVHGAVVVQPLTDAPDERFAPGCRLQTGGDTLTVASSRWQGNRLIVEFAGIADRDAAYALHGTELHVPASGRPTLDDPNDFYDTDLIGLAASTVDGTPLGPVRDVVHAPAGDYLVVEVGGRERLVPFVATIVPSVDVAGGRVVVDPPEGLFDL
jgi:16S rRNA processing protein RimM